MRALTLIVACVAALALAGCPDKSKSEPGDEAAAEKTDAESGEKPPEETIEKLKSLGYIQ